MVSLRVLFSLLLFLLITSVSTAQTVSHTNSSISIWSGYSPTSMRLIGKINHTTTSMLMIGYKRGIRSPFKEREFFYTADLIPYISYNYPRRDYNDSKAVAHGFGISPAGFFLQSPLNKVFDHVLKTSGGIILIDRTFPTDKARKLNFTFDISTAFQLHISKNFTSSVGYKYHHISNANTGNQNPGIDSNFLFLSISYNQ